MPEIADSRTKFQEVKENYEPLRTKLLEADSKWVDADKDLEGQEEGPGRPQAPVAEADWAANKAKADARKAAAAAAAAAAAQNAANSQQPTKPRRGY